MISATGRYLISVVDRTGEQGLFHFFDVFNVNDGGRKQAATKLTFNNNATMHVANAKKGQRTFIAVDFEFCRLKV